MSKLTLTNLADLQNETTAVNAVNANNVATTTAVENTLSRDGTAPNTMGAVLDMNSNHIINLPAPVGTSEPLRLQDAALITGGTFTPLPVGGTTNQTLKKNSNTNYDVGWGNGVGVTSVGLTLPADFTVTGSPVTAAGTLAATYVAGTPTGTGAFVRANSPTLVSPNLDTPTALVLTNATGLPATALAAQAANTFIVNNSGSSAVPTAVDIPTFTTKASPAGSDYILLSDQAASGALKKATVSSIGTTSGVSTIAGNAGAFTLSSGLTNTVNDLQMASGTIIGSVIGTYTAATALTTVIPADDTIPQNTEGTQIISVSYTPKISTSTLLCEFNCNFAPTAADNVIGAIFNAGSANAFAASMVNSSGASIKTPMIVKGSYVPGATTAQTITVRIGPSTAASITLNGTAAARLLGGSSAATLTVYEIKA